MTEAIPIRDTLRFAGELNNIHYYIRQMYLFNIDKQDNLNQLKTKFSKGEYTLLINNLGKTISRIYLHHLPECHVSSFWINNLSLLNTIEKDIISINYVDDDDNVQYSVMSYFHNCTIDELKSLKECGIYRLTGRIVDVGLPDTFLERKCQKITIMDDYSSNTLEVLLHGNYVDAYKWKYDSEVELIGYLIDHPLLSFLPEFQVMAIEYTEEYTNKLNGLIELEKSERNTPEYNYWREQVLERDKVCQGCGSSKSPEAHHIFSYKYNPDLRINPENGIRLCERCHNEYHSKYGKIATPLNLIKFITEYGSNFEEA